jgi:hypothetical protein
MSRRKSHPSAWVVLTCLLLIGGGIATETWQPSLIGLGVLITLFFGWIALRNTVNCDVNRRSKPEFCEHPVKGSLFGCGDHYWHKVLAWSRYLGTGYIARKLHVELPILRWQAGVPPQPPKVVAFTRFASAIPKEAPMPYTPSPFIQGVSIYMALAGSLATVAALGVSIATIH